MRDPPEVHLYRVNSMMLYIYLILLLKVAAVFIIISTVFIIANSLEEVDKERKNANRSSNCNKQLSMQVLFLKQIQQSDNEYI
jgi:hypothetical protein